MTVNIIVLLYNNTYLIFTEITTFSWLRSYEYHTIIEHNYITINNHIVVHYFVVGGHNIICIWFSQLHARFVDGTFGFLFINYQSIVFCIWCASINMLYVYCQWYNQGGQWAMPPPLLFVSNYQSVYIFI